MVKPIQRFPQFILLLQVSHWDMSLCCAHLNHVSCNKTWLPVTDVFVYPWLYSVSPPVWRLLTESHFLICAKRTWLHVAQITSVCGLSCQTSDESWMYGACINTFFLQLPTLDQITWDWFWHDNVTNISSYSPTTEIQYRRRHLSTP